MNILRGFGWKRWQVLVLTLLASLLASLTLLTLVSTASTIPPSDRTSIALGYYVDGFPGGLPGTTQSLDDFSETVGGEPAFIMWYQDWVGSSGFVAEHFTLLDGRPTTPMLTWQPWDPEIGGGSVNQPEYKLSKIATGAWDAYIRQTARDMRGYGKPIYLRFAHEMNGDWTPWGIGVNCDENGENCNRPEEYVAAWRHVHDIFIEEGATNVRWVWSPSERNDRVTYASLYPGDDYVDWVAVDGYNWAIDNGGWRSFHDIVRASYDEIYGSYNVLGDPTSEHLTSKPMMIGETASSEDLRDSKRKGDWIANAYLSALPEHFPRIKAVVWFHEKKERDWRVDSTPESLSAYKLVVADPKYQDTLP